MIRLGPLVLVVMGSICCANDESEVTRLFGEQLKYVNSLSHGRVVLRSVFAEGMSIAEAQEKDADSGVLRSERYDIMFSGSRIRAAITPEHHTEEEIRVRTPDYVINIRAGHRELLSGEVADQVDRAGAFDPRLLHVSSNPTSILFHTTVEKAILINDIRNPVVEQDDLGGITLKKISFDRAIGNRFERWFVPAEGYSVPRSVITSKRFAGAGPLNGKSTVSTTERKILERQPGVWFPSEVRHVTSLDGRIVGEEVISIESADFRSPIPDEVFTLAGVGVAAGDEVHHDGHVRMWNGSEIVDVTAAEPPRPAMEPQPTARNQWLLIANAALLAAAALILLFRRRLLRVDPENQPPNQN